VKHLGFFLREAAASIWRGGVLTVAATGAVALAALVAGVFGTAYYNLYAVYEKAQAELYLDVYLKDGISDERAAALGEHFRKFHGVGRAEYISRQAAAEEFVGLFPEDRELLTAAGANPLPASYRVYLNVDPADAAAVARLARDFGAMDGVEDVVYGREWLDNLNRAARAVALAGGAVALLLGGAAVLVVMSTIGLAVHARRDTISIMKIVGATDAFVQAPFLCEGFIIGLVGGGAAAALLFAGVTALTRWGVVVRFPPVQYILAGLAAAALIGAFGAFVSVRRFLKV